MKYALIILCLAAGSATAGSLTLSPAVVPLGGKPGQSTTQRLTLFNGTEHALAFDLVAQDVIVRNGARSFVVAGDVAGSIAATAVFSTRKVSLRPGEERSVEVTLTLPAQATHRAVVILFRGTTRIGSNATVSMGSLLTFDLSGRASIAIGALDAKAPTPSTNSSFTVSIINDGTEPILARGAVAIVGSSGSLFGKITLEPRRLLPGERTALLADYPGDLPSGSYRVIATISRANVSTTRITELVVP